MKKTSIPKIIHQTWKGADIPPAYAAYQQSWFTHHPEWEYRLWTDADNRALIEQHYPWFLPIYDNYPQPIMRADAVRYFILHRFGGLYIDLDFESLQPVDETLAQHEVAIGLEPASHARGVYDMQERPFEQILCNAFMASVPRHPFWEHLFKVLVGQHLESYALSATGPYMLTRAYESFPDSERVFLVAAALVCPIPYGTKWHSDFIPSSATDNRKISTTNGNGAVAPEGIEPIAVHHWMAIWRHKGTSSPKWLFRKTLNRFLRDTIATRLDQWGYRVSRKTAALLSHEVKRRHLVINAHRPLLPAGVAVESNQIRFALLNAGQPLTRGVLDEAQCLSFIQNRATLPMVSAIMMTAGCLRSVQRAVANFQAQSYPKKELIVIDSCPNQSIAQWLDNLSDPSASSDPSVRYVPSAADSDNLQTCDSQSDGFAAWNLLASQHATGTYVTFWSDRILAHTNRLALQVSLLQNFCADMCCLQRVQVWDLKDQRLLFSKWDVWETGGLYVRSKVTHETIREGGDESMQPLSLSQQMAIQGRLLLLDHPQLATKIWVDSDAEIDELDEFWSSATARYEGISYDSMLQKLQTNLKHDLSEWTDDVMISPHVGLESTGIKQADAKQIRTDRTVLRSLPPLSMPTPTPRVLVASILKNERAWLPQMIRNLEALTYPHKQLTLAFLDCGSQDGTHEWLKTQLTELRAEFGEVKLFSHDLETEKGIPREFALQRAQQVATAQHHNILLSQALADEEWVLWMNAKIAASPADLIEQMLHLEQSIVVPNVIDKACQSSDRSTFKLQTGAEKWDWSPYILDGILQPPDGHGRTYLSDLNQHSPIELDSVGSRLLLIQADLHRKGLFFPVAPYKYHIGSEGLAYLARDMNIRCWGIPQLEVLYDAGPDAGVPDADQIAVGREPEREGEGG